MAKLTERQKAINKVVDLQYQKGVMMTEYQFQNKIGYTMLSVPYLGLFDQSDGEKLFLAKKKEFEKVINTIKAEWRLKSTDIRRQVVLSAKEEKELEKLYRKRELLTEELDALNESKEAPSKQWFNESHKVNKRIKQLEHIQMYNQK